eukprot:COSAG06_NODE_968_length_11280_cov_125.578302_5_plen_171_part_00
MQIAGRGSAVRSQRGRPFSSVSRDFVDSDWSTRVLSPSSLCAFAICGKFRSITFSKSFCQPCNIEDPFDGLALPRKSFAASKKSNISSVHGRCRINQAFTFAKILSSHSDAFLRGSKRSTVLLERINLFRLRALLIAPGRATARASVRAYCLRGWASRTTGLLGLSWPSA